MLASLVGRFDHSSFIYCWRGKSPPHTHTHTPKNVGELVSEILQIPLLKLNCPWSESISEYVIVSVSSMANRISQGEKPPKIRKKKFPGTKFLATFGPPPTEKTEKIGKIKGTLVRKVPGNLRCQEFVFFSWAVFLPPRITYLNVKNPHTWCGGFSGSFFTIKLGKFWNFDLFFGPLIEVVAVFFSRRNQFPQNPGVCNWRKRKESSKDPHPQDKIQHLDCTKDPRPLYYKTPPCVFHHKNVRSKAVFGP